MKQLEKLSISSEKIISLAKKYGTPFYFYDEKSIRQRVRFFLKTAYKYFPQFKEFFAVKALPNPAILQILKEEGCGLDCASVAELWIGEKLGFKGEEIIFSSNYTQKKEFALAQKIGAIVNLDDITLLDSYLKTCSKTPEIISFRYNPGQRKSGDNNFVTGKLDQSKYGLTKKQMLKGYQKAKKLGIKRFAMHAFLGSNELKENYFTETAQIMMDLAGELYQKTGIKIEFINTSGGLGIPYQDDEPSLNIDNIFVNIRKIFQQKSKIFKMPLPNLVMESGRWITGPFGFLTAKVVAIKNTYKKFVGLDASMANLMRPAMYDAYHHIEVINSKNRPLEKVNVVGPLCENNDQFAKDRILPQMKVDDLVVIENCGAHAHSMGFQYNGRLRCAEVLLQENGQDKLIRRHETVEDYFQTALFKK